MSLTTTGQRAVSRTHGSEGVHTVGYCGLFSSQASACGIGISNSASSYLIVIV